MFCIENIHSKGRYPSCALSNFAPHQFEIDGWSFGCMEGFLQSLKFETDAEKCPFTGMTGREAKEAGTHKSYQRLYWQNKPYARCSKEYRQLLTRAYEALCTQNKEFAAALVCSYPRILLHTIGKWRRRKTVLTWWEFCFLLTRLRKKLLRGSLAPVHDKRKDA